MYAIWKKYCRNLLQNKNGACKAKLTIAPIINFRDFHTVNENHDYNIKQSNKGNKLKVILDGNSVTPIYMNMSDGTYIPHEHDIFKGMFYIKEAERGFPAEEK